MQVITFDTEYEFFSFVKYAAGAGLAYKARRNELSEWQVTITGC